MRYNNKDLMKRPIKFSLDDFMEANKDDLIDILGAGDKNIVNTPEYIVDCETLLFKEDRFPYLKRYNNE